MTDPARLHAQLIQAFNQRDWRTAREVALRLLPLAPAHAPTLYVAGIAHLEMQEVSAAVGYLDKAASLEPTRADYAVHHAKALVLARRSRDAKAVAERALALSSSDPGLLDTLGVVFTHVSDYTSAATVFRQAAALAPQHAPFRYNLATSLVSAGAIDAAETELEACLALDPHHWLGHLTLAQLRRQTSDSNHVARLQRLLSEAATGAPGAEAQTCLHLALAKEYEDLGDYPGSFDHLVRGKSAGAIGRNYSIGQDEALFRAITDAFDEPGTPVEGCPTDEPIFIIGMPRSGTTLVERIISSHPDVQSAGELLNFGMSLKYASGSRTPAWIDVDTIDRARHVDWNKLGESYLASTRPLTGRSPRFIDKLPHNFLYAGFIARALPRAKIICLRRDPMDTCLSNFRQLFGVKSPYFGYSFDLLDTGRYYVLFDRLMAHWQRMFPGRILEVSYESLVEAQEASSRQLMAFCGLPWDDACLRFESNPSPVATASAVQVRAPLYRSALQRWRKYEPQLGELRALLSDAGIPLGEPHA